MPILQTIPIERPAIWGGTRLREYFRYPWFGDAIGQSWSFSAQADASNVIQGGPHDGKTLRMLWQEQPNLFQSRFSDFPVIISLVAPMDDLSIQIHPNASIAKAQGYSTGKNEAWYFLEAPAAGNIVYGHRAPDKAALRDMIASDRWDALLDYLPVQQGDFVYLPAGILHALRKGAVVYEIQQATDVTYRFYDYHRKDAQGQERPLHLEQAIACVDDALGRQDAHPLPKTNVLAGGTETVFIRNESFCVSRYEIKGEQALRFDGYQLCTVVGGAGTADGIPLQIGSNFLLPAYEAVLISGHVTLMATCEPQTRLVTP